MFERELEDMTAIVTVEPGLFDLLTASNVGVPLGAVYLGSRIYSFAEALQAIYAIDRALLSCAKAYQKRIRAQRMSFVFAFGPDMENYASKNCKNSSRENMINIPSDDELLLCKHRWEAYGGVISCGLCGIPDPAQKAYSARAPFEMVDLRRENVRLSRRNVVFGAAIKDAYRLIDIGMEIRAKQLLGAVMDAGFSEEEDFENIVSP